MTDSWRYIPGRTLGPPGPRVRDVPREAGDISIGRMIARHRRRKGIKQTELGTAIGSSGAWVSRAECGYAFVSPARRTQIAEALGLPPSTFGDPLLMEVTPEERDLVEAFRRSSGRVETADAPC